jgi:hypothetical protein
VLSSDHLCANMRTSGPSLTKHPIMITNNSLYQYWY